VEQSQQRKTIIISKAVFYDVFHSKSSVQKKQIFSFSETYDAFGRFLTSLEPFFGSSVKYPSF
jgi:hypothetical protein